MVTQRVPRTTTPTRMSVQIHSTDDSPTLFSPEEVSRSPDGEVVTGRWRSKGFSSDQGSSSAPKSKTGGETGVSR